MSINLKEINASAYSYAASISSQMKAICQPLLGLGINYFSYMKIYSDGSYLNLDTDLKYCKAYFETIKDQGHFFTRFIFPKANESKYKYDLFNNLNLYDKNKDPIRFLLCDFNKSNCFTMYKLDSEGAYESYNFSIIHDEVYVSTFFLNHLEILEHFIDYFNEKASDLINSDDKNKLAYLEQVFNFHNLPEYEVISKKIKDFLIKTKLQGRLINGVEGQVKLANREFECLEYLVLGKSIKEIGRILDLSPRTIEFYLRNTKSKTGYKSKNRLLAQFIKDFKSVDFTKT